jgi:hypothetical protein
LCRTQFQNSGDIQSKKNGTGFSHTNDQFGLAFQPSRLVFIACRCQQIKPLHSGKPHRRKRQL